MIPNKSSFKFQELTPITGVKPYVLRFWETEFSSIDPATGDGGQKIYSKKDVEAILRIKKLLFEDKLSIPEARMVLEGGARGPEIQQTAIELAREKLREGLELVREIRLKRKW